MHAMLVGLSLHSGVTASMFHVNGSRHRPCAFQNINNPKVLLASEKFLSSSRRQTKISQMWNESRSMVQPQQSEKYFINGKVRTLHERWRVAVSYVFLSGRQPVSNLSDLVYDKVDVYQQQFKTETLTKRVTDDKSTHGKKIQDCGLEVHFEKVIKLFEVTCPSGLPFSSYTAISQTCKTISTTGCILMTSGDETTWPCLQLPSAATNALPDTVTSDDEAVDAVA